MNQTCTTVFSASESSATALWNIYSESFVGAGEECAQNQSCYDETSFRAAMVDPDYAKIIAYENDEPVGFSLMTRNLEKARITSVNPQKLRNLYPQEAAEGRIIYCTAMGIRPDAQKRGNSMGIFRGMATLLREHKAVLAFDYGNDKPTFQSYVSQMFARERRAFNGVRSAADVKDIGSQTFCTLDFFR